MTKQNDIIGDDKYLPVLDHGFVGLVDHMGSDADIVSAARVSYGAGTKTVNEDRGLIRYLISHRHTSPIEMAEVKIHVKMPIFIARQWIRHRTASINEYSGRYSLMSDEFYMPDRTDIQPQSKDNKQGRAGKFTDEEINGIEFFLDAAYDHSYKTYQALVKPAAEWGDQKREVLYDPYSSNEEFALFDENYPGLTRELSRIALPLATYTEFYWKQDLHNLLHLLKLRRDSHAQAEVRAYADAVYRLIKPLFPLTIEAWEDYVYEGRHLSKMDVALLKDLLQGASDYGSASLLEGMIAMAGGEKAFAQSRNMSLRELRAFQDTWNV